MTHNPGIQGLWKLDNSRVKPEIQLAASKLFDWLDSRDDNLSRLITGRVCQEPREDGIRNLEHDIIARFKPLRETVLYLRALALVVERGNCEGLFRLCPPRVPTLVKHTPSPFREGRMPLIARPRLWREAAGGPVHVLRASEEDMYIGRILISAAVNGGLLHPSLLAALCDLLQDRLSILEDRSYFELHLPWQGKPDMELRRWFPDPLTELLILNLSRSRPPARFSEAKRGSTTGDVWRYLRAFFKAAITDKSYRPKNITEFFELISLELKTQIPVFLVVYAERRFVSHSLKDYVWDRLHGVPVADKKSEQSGETEDSVDNNVPDSTESDVGDVSAFIPPWLDQLNNALGGKDKKVARKKIAALTYPEDTGQEAMFTLLTRWTEYMLVEGSATGNPLRLSTIRDYIRRVGIRVVGLSAFQDITMLTTDALEEIYQQIIEGAISDGQRRHHARGLREFHHFLVRRYQMDPINEREVLGVGNALAPVDANLLTEDEYQKVLAQIDEVGLDIRHPDLPIIAKLLCILSFRCGLRRSEILRIEARDLHDNDPAELIVRPYEHRSLKTKSSTRKIPLYALLEPDELALLKQWKAKRVKQWNKSKEPFFLFGIPELLYTFVPQESIFPVIHRVMREVTGDPTVRFHHLRHSFASWTLFRLFLSDLKTPPDPYSHLPATRAFLATSKDFRKALYGHDKPTRKHLFAVASLLGHSGPDVSLAHYIHASDLALAVALANRPDAVAEAALVRYSGLAEATAYRLLKQGGTVGLLKAVRKRAKSRIAHPKASQSVLGPQKRPKAITGVNKGDDGLAAETIKRVWGYLFARSAQNKPREEQARRLGFSLAQAEALEQQAEYLRDLRVTGKGKGWRHRMMKRVPDKRFPEKTQRLFCPREPRQARDKVLIQELAPRLWRLMQTDEVLCRRVLDYYATHAWTTRNELVFHDPSCPEPAKDYLAFLKALGIDWQNIRFTSYHRGKRSRAVATWKAALGLGWRVQIGRLAPPNSTRQATDQWFGIKPLFKTNAGEEGSYGFRFLLMMAAIYIHSIQVYRSST
jgi:integrase